MRAMTEVPPHFAEACSMRYCRCCCQQMRRRMMRCARALMCLHLCCLIGGVPQAAVAAAAWVDVEWWAALTEPGTSSDGSCLRSCV